MNRIRALLALDPPARSVLAMAIALLAAWALARAGAVPFAAVSLAEAIMARTPPDLANSLLLRLGGLARPFALLGGIATYLGLAALPAIPHVLPLGRTAARAEMLVLALAWPALVWLFALPVAPNLALAVAWLLIVAVVTSLFGRRQAAPGRRDFLKGFAVSSAAVLIVANIVFIDAIRRGAAGRGGGGQRLFAWEPPPPRSTEFPLAGLPPEVTPVAGFYRMSKNVVDPELDGGLWSLLVGTRRWRLDELMALPRVDVYCTLRCISNRVDSTLMSTALFSGVRLRDLLAASGEPLVGECVVVEGVDGHRDSIPVAAAGEDDTLVAWGMNGAALTRDHGFPARLLIPGRYGFKSIKWLRRISVSATPFTGNWQELGWTRDALVKTMSRIDVVQPDDQQVTIGGIAFAGVRGISAVQVRFDDGPWQVAALNAPALGRSAWVQWRITGPSGARNVTARAVDGAGQAQPEEERPQFPDGAQGLHRVRLG